MDGARPVERPVGQAGLQGHRVCVYVCVCVHMQGMRVLSLVREDPTCHGVTKPMQHND